MGKITTASKSIIELVTHPYAWETMLARHDHAKVTNQPLIERAWWLKNIETGQLYHDIYGCIGWPSEIKDQDEGVPGYVGVVGVVKPLSTADPNKLWNPLNAKFQLLGEAQSTDIPTLLKHCLELRERFGLGVQENLMRVWHGDQDRFLTTLALTNERLIKKGGDKAAILISPPMDFYVPKIFDNYARAIRSCFNSENPKKSRFFFGYCEILKNRLGSYERDDPAVFAMGGLIHTLLTECTWCDNITETVFRAEENV
jgi:hypothetical protein